MRICPVDGCGVAIKPKLLMCPEHWGLCPRRLRSEVWRWYRAGQERKPELVTDHYRAAAKQAIEAVETALVRDEMLRRQGILL